ncbi:hypothetical protein [Halegenticoccus tardaugens]|uniref:hypothetical protein n=1 Tax=Halegenticoccus tardaugens TaxID=2071624 RepID=UPI00100AFD87|nr:hypothetical protein [Halegenticoccus tardaugens]
MVGPSISDEGRRTANARLKIGFVALVGLSGGLVALQVNPTLPQLAAAVVGGLVVGWLLLWFLVRSFRRVEP